jgi:hypothetical protein
MLPREQSEKKLRSPHMKSCCFAKRWVCDMKVFSSSSQEFFEKGLKLHKSKCKVTFKCFDFHQAFSVKKEPFVIPTSLAVHSNCSFTPDL